MNIKYSLQWTNKLNTLKYSDDEIICIFFYKVMNIIQENNEANDYEYRC
jgi:hypothetical protein